MRDNLDSTRHLFVAAVFIVGLWLLTGCVNPIPMQQQSGASMAASEALAAKNALEIEQTIQGQPTPPVPITVSGASNNVDVVVNPQGSDTFKKETNVNSQSDQESKSEIEQSWYKSSKLPWSIALGIAVVSLTGLFFLLKNVIKSSAAVRSIAKGGDQLASGVIDAVRAKATAALSKGDKDQAFEMQNLVADLQKARGKFKSDANGFGKH